MEVAILSKDIGDGYKKLSVMFPEFEFYHYGSKLYIRDEDFKYE
jgi:hypothetical protein